MTRWAIIYNPVAGHYRQRTMEAIERQLHGQGITTVTIPTAYAGHATEIARGLPSVDCVAVYGGDGTLNEVVNGLAAHKSAAKGLAKQGLPLAFLPGGTANVMAHELGLPRDPVLALGMLLRGEPRPVRPGRVGGRLFLLMAGFGFDGAAVYGVSPAVKRWSGKGAYVWSGLRALMAAKPVLRVTESDGPQRSGAWVVAARAGHYGGQWRIHPRAGLMRERLGLTVVGSWGLLPFLAGNLGMGFARAGPCIWLDDRTRLVVESSTPFHVQVDGDYFGSDTKFQVDLADVTIPLCFPGRPPTRNNAGKPHP
ncbi:MAG: hypothetical protein IID61_10940 [SAR324 cluster bacterium]|nr:hypothetical protein [SAR324 cluster bacterium]